MMNEITMSVSRPSSVGSGSAKIAYQSTGLSLSGFLEKSTAEFAALTDGEFTKTFNFFCDDFNADVKIGDRLISDDGTEYSVRGVINNNIGPGRRLEVVLHLPHET